MTDKEKLIELAKHIVVPYFAKEIADYLVANGVIVQKCGRWTRIDYRPLAHDYLCSLCNYASEGAYNYCPNCGTKMYAEKGNV